MGTRSREGHSDAGGERGGRIGGMTLLKAAWCADMWFWFCGFGCGGADMCSTQKKEKGSYRTISLNKQGKNTLVKRSEDLQKRRREEERRKREGEKSVDVDLGARGGGML